MDTLTMLHSFERKIQMQPTNPLNYEDCFETIRLLEKEDFSIGHGKSFELRNKIETLVKTQKLETDFIIKVGSLHKKTLLFDARHNFDCFLRYIESGSPIEKKFYAPRRNYLLPVVNAYQEVLDGKLKLLTVSLIKRGGKSQTEINFVNMLSGIHPTRSTLMEGTGDDLVKSFYLGCLEYLQQPSQYLFYDIFPECKLVQTNADTKIINLDDRSRFPTIMCRSIDAKQVGLSEATNVLVLDDCIEGREEAKNRQRLDEKWERISGDVIGRAIEGTPIIASGTRYSMYDVIGHLQEEAVKNDWTWKAIETPALDLITDESNYEYYNPKVKRKIFTTKFFREQRAILSEEQFESEFQQQPFEAKGLMFPADRLNRYFELPVDKEPDAIVSVCDTAESGEDSVMMPIAYIYGEDVFIADCVFDNSAPDVTKPQCAKLLVEHKVSTAVFESNNAGEYYARDVGDLVKKLGGKVSVRTKRTISNKQTRIEFASDGIIKHFYFKDKSLYKPSDQYGQMMKELTTHTRSGKVRHDDAADGMSLLENEIRGLFIKNEVSVFRRPY